MKQFLPFLNWLMGYNKSTFYNDLVAGLTVGVMLIPQGMAYAVIAGLPPIYGLYASTIPLLIYAVFGTSRQLAVGPTALIALLTASGLSKLQLGSSAEYIQMAIVLTLMVGVVKLLMGFFRLGFLTNFLSHPVIGGFTSAAALIIAFSQLKHLLGINIPRSNFIHEIFISATSNISQINWLTLLVGLCGIILLISSKKINKKIPAALLLLVFGISITYFLQLHQQGLAIVKDIPAGLPSFAIPNANWSIIQLMLPTALTIAFISYIESFAVAKAIRNKHKNYKISANQELIALGLSNIGGAFFSSFPVTGGFSRSAVNDQAGAKTGLAAIISAFIITITLLFLTPLFYFLPKALLAAIIIVAVVKLIHIKEARFLWRANKKDFTLMLITFLGTLGLGIENGILLGVILSLGVLIYITSRPHIAVLGKVDGTNSYRNLNRFPNIKPPKETLIIRVDSQLCYTNIIFFEDEIQKLLQENPNTKQLVLDFQSVSDVDISAIHGISEIIDECKQLKIQLVFTSLIGPVRDAFSKAGLMQKLGADHFFLTIEESMNYLKNGKIQIEKKDLKPYVLQTNT